MATVRTFIAVFPPEEVRFQIEAELGELRAIAPEAKWVSPENYHFTLRFLGSLPEERLDHLARCVAESVVGEQPFEVCLSALGAFPTASRPRVLWVGAGCGAERLTGLARAVEARLRNEGYGPADKPFAPHLTVARWRNPKGRSAVSELVGTKTLRILPFLVEEVHVMESVLRPQGPLYSSRARCPLEG